MDSSPAIERKTSNGIFKIRRFVQKISTLFRQTPSQEEPDILTNHLFDQLQGGTGDPVSQATLDNLADEMKNQGIWPGFNVPYTGPAGNDNPYERPPDDEPPIDPASEGREDSGPDNNENVDIHDNNDNNQNREYVIHTSENLLDLDVMDGGSEGQGTRSRIIGESQAGVGIIPSEISSSMMNNEPAISENYSPETISPNNETTVESEVPSTESGYQSSASTSSSSNVCSRIAEIEIPSSPKVMETEEDLTSSMLYVPARPPRARDFNNQQEPTVADLSQQIENSPHVPDDFEFDSYEKIFLGPLPNPENQTVGPSSSDHGYDFQHQSWSSTTETIPSGTESGYQSRSSTSSPSNVPFPEVMETEYGEPTSSQCLLYAPAHSSTANDLEIFDSQQPKQYFDLDKNASGSMHQVTTKYDVSGSGISEPWSSYYGIGFQHQSPPSLTDEIPSHSAKRKRSSPNSSDQCHYPAKKSRLDGRQLPYSPSASVQRPITQEFNHESCNLNTTTAKKSNRRCKKRQNATSAPVQLPVSNHDSRNSNLITFESNAGSIRQHDVHSPPVQHPDAQEHPLDFLGLKPFQEFVEKKEKYLKIKEKGDTAGAERVRKRTDVEDESLREEMDRACDYSKKCAQKKKDSFKDRTSKFVERVQQTEGITLNERMAIFSLELDDFLAGRVDNSDREAYETGKRRLFSTGVNSEIKQKIQETWKLFVTERTNFQKRSQEYEEAAKKAETLSKQEEKKKATNSPGSAKSRAKTRMEDAQLDYDIACLGLIISKKSQLRALSLEFARRCANKVVPIAIFDAKKIEEWVLRNGKTKEWNELKLFVEANPELRRSDLYN